MASCTDNRLRDKFSCPDFKSLTDWKYSSFPGPYLRRHTRTGYKDRKQVLTQVRQDPATAPCPSQLSIRRPVHCLKTLFCVSATLGITCSVTCQAFEIITETPVPFPAFWKTGCRESSLSSFMPSHHLCEQFLVSFFWTEGKRHFLTYSIFFIFLIFVHQVASQKPNQINQPFRQYFLTKNSNNRNEAQKNTAVASKVPRSATAMTYFDLIFLAGDKNDALFGGPSESLNPLIQIVIFLNSEKFFHEISAEITDFYKFEFNRF